MKENKEMIYPIGAFAKMTAITERTLRYYDRKGLLKPSSRNEQGHRYYTDKDLIQLQKILTLKYWHVIDALFPYLDSRIIVSIVEI